MRNWIQAIISHTGCGIVRNAKGQGTMMDAGVRTMR